MERRKQTPEERDQHVRVAANTLHRLVVQVLNDLGITPGEAALILADILQHLAGQMMADERGTRPKGGRIITPNQGGTS